MIAMTVESKARASLFLVAALLCGACSKSEADKSASSNLEEFVRSATIGEDADYWIEMKNMSGEWEKTGLIFGYYGDHEECEKAISGLKAANDAREYRCELANIKAS